MSSVSCDLLTSCHCIYHFRSRCKHWDVFLSSSGVVGNAVLCFCLVQIRKILLCMCHRFKNESFHNPSKPQSVDAIKLTFISLYGHHCRRSSLWLPLWFAAHHFSMSREKRTGRLRRARKLYLSCLLIGGLGRAFVILRVTSARSSVHCCCTCWAAGVSNASVLNLQKHSMLIVVCFLLGNSPASEFYIFYIYI